MQALGIIIEDAVRAIYRTIQGQDRSSERPKGWKYLLGSFWLLFWLVWTTPDWSYPITRRSELKGILPFSILGMFGFIS